MNAMPQAAEHGGAGFGSLDAKEVSALVWEVWDAMPHTVWEKSCALVSYPGPEGAHCGVCQLAEMFRADGKFDFAVSAFGLAFILQRPKDVQQAELVKFAECWGIMGRVYAEDREALDVFLAKCPGAAGVVGCQAKASASGVAEASPARLSSLWRQHP